VSLSKSLTTWPSKNLLEMARSVDVTSVRRWCTALEGKLDTRAGLLSKTAKPGMGSHQPPVQWVPGVKRPEREGDH
jgi:hypothetical protein